jgi:radical SAM C-methyltransferase
MGDGLKRLCLVELTGEKGYVTLAAAYLAAYARTHEAIANAIEIALVVEHYQEPVGWIIDRVVSSGIPDILAISCQGWSARHADRITEHVRGLNPSLLVVYGGNHVSHQGEAFFAGRPFVDVLVDGEGEVSFRELLVRYLENPGAPDFTGIAGLSIRHPSGKVLVNPGRPRLENLDSIPSPYLTGLLDEQLRRGDTALLETNRGCPYHCSFCYWGEAVGQRLHKFSLDRLKAEMEFLARRQVDSWYICDANFGLTPQDSLVVDEILRLRRVHGFPRTVHTNWAKNSNARIVQMCARLNQGGVHSTYTLALQSTTESALVLAKRSNMKINRIDEISQLCRRYGVVPRGELIWGLPGEDYAGFLASYDTLALYTDALSVYPLYVLPNTEYARSQERYGIVTRRPEPDTDYQYCVQHSMMSYEDFLAGMRFIVANNILKVGGAFMRLYPRVAQAAAGIPFSRTIGEFAGWVLATDHAVARRFRGHMEDPITRHRQSLSETWLAIARDRDGVLDMVEQYAEERLHPGEPEPVREILREALRFDRSTYPVLDDPVRERRQAWSDRYVSTAEFSYDFLGFKQGRHSSWQRGRHAYRIEHAAGLWRYPMGNWYFGLIRFEGHAEPVAPVPAVSAS